MKILVTGATGQVGDKLRGSLAALGEVIVTEAPAADPEKRYAPLDLTDLAAVEKLVRALAPSVIVNAAAYTAVDKAETEFDKARLINGDAVGVLGREAKALGARVVHYSTDYVFDGGGSMARDESAPIGPISAYGKTKLAGEEALKKSGASSFVLRTSWVFSDHGHNFVKTMLRLGGEREALKVVADQIGAPTSARLLADATAVIIRSGKAQPAMALYHLACAGETSWHGFATEIFRQARGLGIPLKVSQIDPIPTEAYPLPAARPKNSRFNCAKIAKDFGISIPAWQDELAIVLKAISRPQT